MSTSIRRGRRVALSTLIVLLAGACGGDGGTEPSGGEGGGGGGGAPVQLVSVVPADGSTDAETGALIMATFNSALNPATLTPASFTLSLGGVPLTTSVTYGPASNTAHLIGPLLPGAAYQALVTTEVTGANGQALAQARSWSFSTRAWQSTSIDQSGDVGWESSLAAGPAGQLHVTYRDRSSGSLKYATCTSRCASALSWQSGIIDQVANGAAGAAWTSLAVDGSGRLHVGYRDGRNNDLKYATCTGGCTVAGNWQIAVVEQSGAYSSYISLAVHTDQRLHIAYQGPDLTFRYATCAVSCSVGGNWQTTVLEANGTLGVGAHTSLVVDPAGRAHVIYQRALGGLRYATCPSGCAVPANWQSATIDVDGHYASLYVDAGGRLHASYIVSFDTLRYATCAAACTNPASWQVTAVEATGFRAFYSSIKLDRLGRIHVSYQSSPGGNDRLRYITCAADCNSAASWQGAVVDQTNDTGYFNSLLVDAAGRVHVAYFDLTAGDLKYIE